MRKALIGLAVLAAAGCGSAEQVSAVATTAPPPSVSTAPTTTPMPPAATSTVTPVPTTAAVLTTVPVPNIAVPGTPPRPTPDQEKQLIAGLLQIEPGFAAKKADSLVSRSRDECSTMLAPNASPEKLIDAAIARFTTADIDAVTRTQGVAIVNLIRSTFCH